jgi:hypothetical protein
MSPAAETVIHRLDAARQKWWLFSLLSTFALAICVSAGLFLVFLMLDARFRFSQGILATMFLVWLSVTGYSMWIVARRLARHDRSLEATARRVESEFPELGSHLINLVQLSEHDKQANTPFREAAVVEAASQVERIAFDAAAKKQSRFRRLLYCMQTPRDLAEAFVLLALVVVAVIYCKSMIPNLGSAANRLLTPWNFVPSVGRAGKIDIKPGDAEVILGGNLAITAMLDNPPSNTLDARLFIQPDGEPETAVSMNVGQVANLPTVGQISNLSKNTTGQIENLSYEATIPSILKPLRYRVEIGDSQSEAFHVTVSEKPMVAEVGVTYQFPRYIGRKDETLALKTPDLHAPQCTVAQLRIRPTVPVTKGYLELNGKKYPGVVQDDGLMVEAKIPLLQDGSYTIHLFVRDKLTDDAPRVNRIQVIPDRPPTVELLKPVRGTTAAPGGEVSVMIRAGDDYGIGRMRLEMKKRAGEVEKQAGGGILSADRGDRADSGESLDAPIRQDKPAGSLDSSAGSLDDSVTVVKTWDDFKNETAPVRQHRVELKSDDIQLGSTILLRATVCDQRSLDDWGLSLKPQEAATPWLEIKIIGAEEKNSAALADLENLRSVIWKILEKQIRARVASAGMAKAEQPADRSTMAGDVRTQQIDIQKSSVEVVKSFAPSENKERQTIKQVLGGLTSNEMLSAVTQSDEITKIKNLAEFKSPLEKLLSTQEKIIDTLRKLLEASRLAEEKMLAEMDKRPGGNLPDDVRHKLEEARDKLNKFLKEQKKIIEAGENLAKTPTEDFTEEQKQALKAMAVAEDDWAKFMKELQTDLSKLPEQDFANASSLKEAVEVQVELKMAADALTKKSVEIAVPLEQLGYERAEELVTNIEKWLPDTPDREKWSQEESLTDKDKEAPMAELPGELEDMIGDLMEQEEDLFDEMEDVTSSAADSLDKGAGWDAMDGPISNMSAKGVTGNRLPNTSEIGGRSGEGRQGKSSGEFVGDEAVGKGGRQTPSRLTPDPVVKGQIKDHSKDSVGGATGGGKESGQGGEGLEGPLPRSPGKRDLERLAGKQAALRNKAESVDLQFQVNNFHQTDMKKMIETMSQVELDLKAGRYQNALRQRPVLLEKMGNVKQYLEGEFQVKQDATSNLPADIQKELLNSMQDPSPQGWEELNRQYFERLSSGEDSGEKK